jgi:hypothetical protein
VVAADPLLFSLYIWDMFIMSFKIFWCELSLVVPTWLSFTAYLGDLMVSTEPPVEYLVDCGTKADPSYYCSIMTPWLRPTSERLFL